MNGLCQTCRYWDSDNGSEGICQLTKGWGGVPDSTTEAWAVGNRQTYLVTTFQFGCSQFEEKA